MLRRSFLASLLGLAAAPAVAKVIPVAPAAAEVVAAPLVAAEVASVGTSSPFILRCVGVYVSVEPIGFTSSGESAHASRWITEDDLPLSRREYENQFASIFAPRHDPTPAEIWTSRLERRARGRLSTTDVARAVEALMS